MGMGVGFVPEDSVSTKNPIREGTPRVHLLCHLRRADRKLAVVTALLYGHRRGIGNRAGRRAGPERTQAMLVLRWF